MFSVLKSFIKWVFIIYVIIGASIWLASPFVADKYIKEFLIEHKLTLSDDSRIYYNPFTQHISINDIALYSENKTEAELTLTSLNFELRLHQIIFDNVYISEFDINGLNLAVDITDDGYQVAGFVIPNETEETETEEIIEDDSAAEPLPYQLVLPQFNLHHSNINVSLNGNSHVFTFNDFSLSGIKASLTQQLFDLTIESSIDKAPLKISVNGELLNEMGSIAVELSLSDLALSRYQYLLPEPEDSIAGQVSIHINSEITLKEANQIDVTIPKYELILKNLALASQGYQVKLLEQVFKGKEATITYTQPVVDDFGTSANDELAPEAVLSVNTNASFELNELIVFLTQEEEQLLSLNNFSLPSIEVDIKGDEQNVELIDMSLTALTVSDRINDDVLPLTTLAGITIDTLNASPLGLAVGNVLIGGINVTAKINEEQELINLITLPEDDSTESEANDEVVTETSDDSVETSEEVNENTAQAFKISLASLALLEPIKVQFSDHSVLPHFERDITINTLSVSALNTEAPDIVTHILLKGTTGKYGKIDFASDITPFDEIPVYAVKGFFNEFDLTGVSSYVRDALSIEIENGELDLSVDTQVTGSELSGGGSILLRRFDFTGIESTTNKKNVNALSFNAALGLLKDGDGNVELDIPLSGDVSDPDFGVSGLLTLIIKRAALSAAKDYLVTALVPYASIVKVAVSAGELALKIRVDDLVFDNTVDSLQDVNQTFVNELSGLLTAKGDLQFKLCAHSTPADIGLPLGQEVTNKEQVAALNAISTKRVESLKDALVEQHGIASSRLPICKNQIDTSKNAKPRITFDS